jgi:glycosyltransferase involved in cell wall biosynthesis
MLLYLGNKLLSKDRNASGIDTLSNLLKSEGRVIRAVSSYRFKPFRLLSMVINLLWFCRKVEYVLIDTYSTNNFYYAFIISKLCKWLQLKYIPILRGGNLPVRLDSSPRMSNLVFNNSYKNIAPSNYLKSEFDKRGFSSTYVPNVIEIKNYKFLERGISTPRLLYVRAFAGIYNPEMAIEVLNKILEKYPEARLCMIGPVKDDSFEKCKALVKELNIEDKVEFTGKLSKSAWYKKAEEFNVFINTTNIDNTPVSVMEAMALGLPVVSTNVGGVPYLIDDKQTGLLVDKGDVDQMALGIEKLTIDNEFRSKLVQNARLQVEKFDWEAVKHQWIKILQ